MNFREYELTYIVADLPLEAAKRVHQEVKGILTKREAQVTGEEEGGLRRLFHKAKNNQNGHFYYVTFKARPDVIQAITAELRDMADVIKFLISRTDIK